MEEKTKESVKVPSIVTVGELAERLSIPVSKVIAELMKNGVMATINENIDFETAEIVADFLGFSIEPEVEKKPESKTIEQTTKSKNTITRPPVIAVLGHVDHGKTSLLDKIRETNVVAKESGGITQHIGAYQVDHKGKKITFLDTPGHEAFEAMRQHGAEITDIAIIIVAADDGIKPQTTEAIKHAKNARTPMIVVVNKIDKPDADPARVRKQFTEIGMTPQEWGGDIEFVDVSSKSGDGIEKLLDTLIVMAELLDLKADPTALSQGVVIESKLEVGKGPVATVLIKNGTLNVSDWIQVGETYGRVKSMEDENGKRLKDVGPSRAVRISGLKSVPAVSELMQEYETEKEAIDAANEAKKYSSVKKVSNVKKLGLDEITAQVAAANKNELSLVIKADVVGSLDAIKESLAKLSNVDVGVKVTGEGVGDVSEKDIQMASASDKIVIGFKVGKSPGVEGAAKLAKVKILSYDVIYELIEDIKTLLAEMMPIEKTEISVGVLKVLAIFKTSPHLTVAGGKVEDGRAEKGANIRVKRNGEVIGEYIAAHVQREKEEMQSVPAGSECGFSIEQKADIAVDDVVEFYRVEEHKKSL